MDLATDLKDIVTGDQDNDICSPTPPARRRKSTRRSLLPLCSPVASGMSSPVICRPRKSALPIQMAEPQQSASKVHSSEKPVSTDVPTSCTGEQLLERYEREISGWERLVVSTRIQLAQESKSVVSLPPLEWIKQDRMLSCFHEVMLPLCDPVASDRPDNGDISLPTLASLTDLAQKACFELHCSQHLLDRQTAFLTSKRAQIKADWDLVRPVTFSNRSLHSYLKDFLSIPQ